MIGLGGGIVPLEIKLPVFIPVTYGAVQHQRFSPEFCMTLWSI